MPRKFQGSLYISRSLTTLPLRVMDSYFLMLQTLESFFLTNLQFLSLSESSDTTSSISMQIPVTATEPFVGFSGPNPSSTLISKENPYTTSPFSNSLWSADWGLTQSGTGVCWNQVSAPLRCLDVVCRFHASFRSFALLCFAQIRAQDNPYYLLMHCL